MRYTLLCAGFLTILPLLGGCSSTGDFWDRSPVVGGEYGGGAAYSAPQPRQAEAPRQAPPQAQHPGPGDRYATRPAPLDDYAPAPRATQPRANDPYSPFAARPPQARAPRLAPRASNEDAQVLAEVNRIRASRGLRRLTFNAALHTAARDHSAEQMRHGYMGHGSPDKTRDELSERIALAGYAGRAYAEVVAWGYQDVRAVVEGWMNSRPHRAILLDRSFSEAAFSRAGKYWTGNFGIPGGRRSTARRPKAAPAPRTYTPRYTPTPAPRATRRPAPRAAPRAAPRPAPKPAPVVPFLRPPANSGSG